MYDIALEHVDSVRRLQLGFRDRGFLFHCRRCINIRNSWAVKKEKKNVYQADVVCGTEGSLSSFCKCAKRSGQICITKNKVHIDETWYYLDKNCNRVLLFPGKVVNEPRQAQHKNDIVKVMLLTAIGMPHHRPDGTYFDGKIGTWPITEQVPAQRISRNRPNGDMEIKPVNLTAEYFVNLWQKPVGIRQCIREILRHLKFSGIVVQQDGARPHIGAVAQINAYIQQNNCNITLVTCSPDLNMLDLGLCNGMKANADGIEGDGRNIDTCVQRMVSLFVEYDATTIANNMGCDV